MPLTLDLLRKHDLTVDDVSWQVTVSNRKVVRRTEDEHDLVHAKLDWFSNHRSHTLKGKCDHFVAKESFVNFGSVRFIKPNDHFPEIRLRFTPAAGLIYGPDRPSEALEALAEKYPGYYQLPQDRQIYDAAKGGWSRLNGLESENQTVPPSLFAIEPPAPSWFNNNEAKSRGYLDDACDGFVEVQLTLRDGSKLGATARICSAPPAMAPDSLFVRTLVDDLEQVINGPEVGPEETAEDIRASAQDIVRRAFETVRFMNVAVMNGNDFKGRSALWLDSMPEEEAAGTQRAIRPVMPPGTVDTFAIMTLHQQVYAALRAGAAPWFLRLLRSPDEAADFTDRGRRKMPALMCGADNNYLALTWRQIDTIRKAALAPPVSEPVVKPRAATATEKVLMPKNLSAQISYEAKGNPISSRPVTSVANCCPGLEVDFRAVWRRLFRGIELREHDNLVVNVDADCDAVMHAKDRRRAQGQRPQGPSPVARDADGQQWRGECAASHDDADVGTCLVGSRGQDTADQQQQSGWTGAAGMVERAGARAASQGFLRSLRFQRPALEGAAAGPDRKGRRRSGKELREFLLRGAALLSRATPRSFPRNWPTPANSPRDCARPGKTIFANAPAITGPRRGPILSMWS